MKMKMKKRDTLLRYNFIKDLPDNAVLIHPVNCEANINYGIMQAVS